MTKKQRIKTVLKGEKPDTMPYSMWGHFPGTDLDPILLAEKTVEFYKQYGIDFIKTMSNGMYAIEDYGCEIDYSEIASGGAAKLVSTPVNTAEDLAGLKPVAINSGSLARELLYLKTLLEKTREEEVPVLFTIFAPITIAQKLSKKPLTWYINEGFSSQLHHALEVITQSTCELAAEAIRLGADGLFLASQQSSYEHMTAGEYREFGKPYDLRVLSSAGNGWMNTIHAHGNGIMFEILRDYPVHVFNWHVWETLPALDEASKLTGKCLMGGLNRTDITKGNKPALQNQIYNCYKLLGGKNQILTPGCVVRYPWDDEVLSYIKETKDLIEEAFWGTKKTEVMI